MSTAPASSVRRRRWAVSAAVAVALGVGAVVRAADDDGTTRPREPPHVHAERSGLRLGTGALTGRVALVASVAGVRWRIVGVSEWQDSDGRKLARGWDTTTVADGAYTLELRRAGATATQRLVVRNSTPLAGVELANASAGLDTRANDEDTVVARFTRSSYRPGDVAALQLGARYPGLTVRVLRVGPTGNLLTARR